MKEIPVIYSPETFRHQPQYEINKGKRLPNAESVKRAQVILHSLRKCGFANINISFIAGLPWIEQVHEAKYLKYLQETSANIDKLVPDQAIEDGEIKALFPSIFPYSPLNKAGGPDHQMGLFAFDTYTPIMKETFLAAVESASCAASGAYLLTKGEHFAYALCRPPGHHAENDKMGGYCYINNCAVAAQFLKDHGAKKVAIFDIDVHHGNGIQSYGYHRSDILYVSIHGSPATTYPYFSGYEDEIGQGEGEGTNYNFPLPPGVNEEKYHQIAQKSLKIISEYRPDYLIVATGFDTHTSDPFHTFDLTTPYFAKLGKVIADINLPTLIVQEGGYGVEILGENVVSFLSGLIDFQATVKGRTNRRQTALE